MRYLKPYRRDALLATVALVASAGAELAIPRLIQRTIDQGVSVGDLRVIITSGLVMLGFALLSAVLTVGNSVWAVRAAQGFGADVRSGLFRSIQGLSWGNLDRLQTGQLLVRLTSDVMQVQSIVLMSFRMFTRAPVMLLGSLAMLVATSPRLALVMLIVLPPMVALVLVIMRRAEPLFRSVQRRLDRLNTIFQENLAGVRVVKAFVRDDYENARLDAANLDLAATNIRVQKLFATLMPSMMLLMNISTVTVLWMAGWLNDGAQAAGGITAGQVMAFVNYLMSTMFPLTMLGMAVNRIAAAEVSAGRILEVIETTPDIQAPTQPQRLETPRGRVRFENVSFSYNGEGSEPVLQQINLSAEPGQTVAILGATGSGKSSLVNLIPRFYDVSAGRVTLDGVDVRDLDLTALRSRVGGALQDAVLFSGSIRENIAYGRPDASEEEIVAAAKAAQAHDFITSFPEGYDTVVGQRGVNLSGGQKQRLSIARALLTHPSVLILDDSTSAVDIETEAKLQDALYASRGERTSFIIAQRISTVLTADKIVVLEQGRVVAEGAHFDLMGSSPIYRDIYESQLGEGGLAHD
jgi:ATP-binding cassette subfamily B protein